jgi:hypothetical protein
LRLNNRGTELINAFVVLALLACYAALLWYSTPTEQNPAGSAHFQNSKFFFCTCTPQQQFQRVRVPSVFEAKDQPGTRLISFYRLFISKHLVFSFFFFAN